jgi:hypothetical protein
MCRHCGVRLRFDKTIEHWVTSDLKWVCALRPLRAHEPEEDIAKTATKIARPAA